MVQAICRVLLHSLWQGILLALAGGLVVLCTKRTAPAVRYRWLCGLFILFLLALPVTFFWEWDLAAGSGTGSGASAISAGWLLDYCRSHANWIVFIWLATAALKSMRLAAGWGYMRQLRREGRTAEIIWLERVEALSRRLGIRRAVKAVESGLVKVPVVIGHLRPIIFIPLGLINHLPAGEMEAVLLHELAHIRRYDHIVNLIQQIAECLLFFNPGLLWVSGLLREERENCCDDMAIAETGNRVEFVRALVRFREQSLGVAALAFTGRRRLLYRVTRISRQQNKSLNKWERFFLAAGLMSLLWWTAVRADRPAFIKRHDVASVKTALVSPELVSVLRAREHVADNMEWVQTQLEQLRRRRHTEHAGGVGKADRAAPVNPPRAAGDELQQLRNEALMLHDRQLVLKEREQELLKTQLALGERTRRNQLEPQRNRLETERNRLETDHSQEQTVLNQEKTVLIPEETARNQEATRRNQERAAHMQLQTDADQAHVARLREDATRDQADRDRNQGERSRQQALQDRQQMLGDQQQALRDQQQAAQDRKQAIKDKELEAGNRQKALKNQQLFIRDRQRADRERAEKAERDRAAAGNSEN